MTQAEMLYCPHCGAPNGSQHRFCGRCGGTLQARVPDAPAAPPPPPGYAAPAQQYPAAAQQYPPPAQQYAPGVQHYPPPAPPPQYAPAGQRYDAPPSSYAAAYAGGAAAPSWGQAPAPAYHPGAFGYPATAPRHATGARRHHWGLWTIAASLVGVIVIGLVAIGIIAIQPRPAACTGPGCTVPPPRGVALPAPHTYTSSTFHYTVRYYNAPGGYDPELASRIQVTDQNATGIDWSVDLQGVDPAGGTWPFGFQGMHADGRSAQQVVQSVISQDTQSGRLVFQVPNAMVGFVHGYGVVYNVQAQTDEGGVVDSRFIVVAAVHNGLAVVFTALGPYNPQQHDHPDPTDTIVSLVVSPLVNGVTFPGMPVR